MQLYDAAEAVCLFTLTLRVKEDDFDSCSFKQQDAVFDSVFLGINHTFDTTLDD